MKAATRRRNDVNDELDTPSKEQPSRRRVLALGAAAASTVITVRPALAGTTGSILNCEIPVPTQQAAGSYIDRNGMLVAAGTRGAFPPAPRAITGEEARLLLRYGRAPTGMDQRASQAYANYIRRLQAGMSGFTCFASLQTPR